MPPFQAFLDEHRDDVYRFLVASVGPQEADDCFQETFLAALRAYPRLRRDSNLRGLGAHDRAPQGDRLAPRAQAPGGAGGRRARAGRPARRPDGGAGALEAVRSCRPSSARRSCTAM